MEGQALDPRTLAEALLEEHRQLAVDLEHIANTVETADAARLQPAWYEFEAGLRRHMAWEEEHLLARYEGSHPAEASHIFHDHDAFRRTLGEIGVQVELHTARADTVRSFVEALRLHAERENATLYPWISTEFDGHGMARLLHHLRDVVRAASKHAMPVL